MISIEQHVTSLALSKRLKELGVKQESIFGWFYRKRPISKWVLVHNNFNTLYSGKNCNKEQLEREVSTYLASELGQMLPEYICIQREGETDPSLTDDFKLEYDEYGTPIYIFMDEWICFGTMANNETDARAKMLIHLIENGLVDDEWRSRWLT